MKAKRAKVITKSLNNEEENDEEFYNSGNAVLDIGAHLQAIRALLTIVRDRNTSLLEYRSNIDRLSTLLGEEALARYYSVEKTVVTPTNEQYHGSAVLESSKLCLVSILRSGDIILEAVRKLVPDALVGKILIQRRESDASAVLFKTWFPKEIRECEKVFVCDPMCGTGGTVVCAITELIKVGVKEANIVFVNLISCPEGLARLYKAFPKVKVITTAIDQKLNKHNYILPGLGDAGDR